MNILYADLKESFVCLPAVKISNLFIAKNFKTQNKSQVDIADSIEKQTGIKERRYALPDEAASSLAIKALQYSTISKEKVNALIVATTSGDFLSPATANFVHAGLNLKNSVHCLDVASSCSSFLSALRASFGFLIEENSDVVVVATEVKHKSLAPDDFRARSLFADGAGGIYLSKSHKKLPSDFFMFTYNEVQSSLAQHICIPVGGSKEPVNETNYLQHNLRLQNTKTLYSHTVKSIARAVEASWEALSSLGNPPFSTIIFIHQANKNLIKEVKTRLKPEIAVCIPILMADVGNMVCASLPVLRARFLYLRSLFYYKNSFILRDALLSEFVSICANTSKDSSLFTYEKKDGGILFTAFWQNEKISIFDDGCSSLEESWMSRIDADEYAELSLIFLKELNCKEKNKYVDIWIAAGGGFQTLALIHGKE